MKLKYLIATVVLITVALFVIYFHPIVESKYNFLPTIHDFESNTYNYVDSKETAFKIAKQIWIKKYGYSSLVFMVFEYRLIDDRYWVIEGSNFFHRLFKINGGGPYIIIEKNGLIHNINYTQ